jgi:dTDP-glucose 4,6-dehydratase
VLDLASPASPDDFKTMPLEILSAGSTGTRNLLDLALAQQARFLLASTSEVYGDPLVHPQPETYWGNVSCIGPRSCYDEAKRFSEALTMAYHRTKGLDVRIARIFNTYGERMRPRDGRVVNTFVRQALLNEALTLHGTGSQTRSFCHVSDEVGGLAAVLDGDVTGPINVGNPAEVTMRELAEVIIELTGSASPIVSVALPAERQGDPLQRCPDISLIKDRLGWEPMVSLRDGLSRMVDWFRTNEDLS